jgi:hypothetical protein
MFAQETVWLKLRHSSFELRYFSLALIRDFLR